jgi:hypothetical protein
MWGFLLQVGIWVASEVIQAARKGSSVVAATGAAASRRRGRHRPGIPHAPEPVEVPLYVRLMRWTVVWGVPIGMIAGGYAFGTVVESQMGAAATGTAFLLAIAGAGLGTIYFLKLSADIEAYFD